MSPIAAFNQVALIATICVLSIVILIYILNYNKVLHAWTGIGFNFCILCYLVVEQNFVRQIAFVEFVVVAGAINIPVFFWLLSKALFDDHFKFTLKELVWVFILLLPRYAQLYFKGIQSVPSEIQLILYILPELVSIGFLLLGLYIALQTRKSDLIDARLKFRNVFMIITASLIGITVIVEIALYGQQEPLVLKLIQHLSIFGLTVLFLVSNFDFRPGSFFQEQPKPKPAFVEDPVLLEKIQGLMEDQSVYKKEGLTISELAVMSNDQEYRVRRVINGQLGYRNFNDFLNQYRIQEACSILEDSNQARKTISEIAYDLGFQSIGPFNKAFKQIKGTTPTTYRKNHQYG